MQELQVLPGEAALLLNYYKIRNIESILFSFNKY